MADEWDKYITKESTQTTTQTTDEWSQYETKEQPIEKSSKLAEVMGGAMGLGGAGLGAYGLAKTGIPQTLIKGVDTVGRGIANLDKVVNIKKGADFAQSIRASFIQAHSDKVATFGNQIEQLSGKYPTQMVSLQGMVDELNNTWGDLSPEARSAIKKTPYLKDMVNVKKPISTNIPLSKSQEIINYMNTKVPKTIRYNNLDVVETLNNIRGSQLEAFPEMEGVRAEYKKFIEPYNQVKSQFKFNKLLNAIKNNFGGSEGRKAVEKILPKDVVKKVGGYRTAAKIAELPQDIPLIGRTLKTIGGMFGYAPMAMAAFRVWQLRNDPEAQYNAMLGIDTKTAKDSFEREVESGRVI